MRPIIRWSVLGCSEKSYIFIIVEDSRKKEYRVKRVKVKITAGIVISQSMLDVSCNSFQVCFEKAWSMKVMYGKG